MIDGSSGVIPSGLDNSTQQKAEFTRAEVVDSAGKLVRLHFTYPVHVGSNLFVCDTAQTLQWKAILDESYTPVYENPYIVNGTKYSDSVIVKFGNIVSTGDPNKLYNNNILPDNGNVVIGCSSVMDYTGQTLSSNFTDGSGNTFSVLKYSAETYAKITKAEALDINTAQIAFSENVIFQTGSPQNYIHIVQSVLQNAPEVACVSVVPVN